MDRADKSITQKMRGWVFPERADLPNELTTYDWLKTAAIVLMIIDHVGYYMFPDIEWFRVVGRLCAPIFFFLIGYARTRDIPVRWWGAIAILLAANLIVGLPPLPIVILLTMILVRVALNPLMGWLARYPIYLWWVVLLCVFAMYPTNMLVEYGTMGVALSMCGYVVRHKEDVGEVFGPKISWSLMVFTFLGFGFVSSMTFGFSLIAIMVLGAGLLGLCFVLQNFEGRVIGDSQNHPHAALIRFMGRYTLEIYVIHLLIFKAYFALSVGAALVIGWWI